MYKKILFVSLILFSIFSVNAGTTTLNSCGNPSGGWLDNEIYILNFTSIDVGYINNYCFSFTNGNYNNIKFIGTGKKILMFKDGSFNMFNIDFSGSWTNMEVSNINLERKINSPTSAFKFFFFNSGFQSGKSINAQNLTINNIELNFNKLDNNFNRFFSIDTTTSNSMATANFDFLVVNNLIIRKMNFMWNNLQNGGFSGRPANDPFINKISFNNMNLNNIFHEVTTTTNPLFNDFWNSQSFNSNRGDHETKLDYNNQRFTNIVSTGTNLINNNGIISYARISTLNSTVTQSIIKGRPTIDINPINNIGENSYTISNILLNNLKVSVKFSLFNKNYNFIQTFSESNSFFSNNEIIVPINIETITPFTLGFVLLNNLTFDFSYSTINFAGLSAFNSNTNYNYDCLNKGSSNCAFTDLFYTGITTAKFRPFIEVIGQNKIQNLNLLKINSNNANYIANDGEFTRNFINIYNNLFQTQDKQNATNDLITGKHLIKLKGNNLIINNNTFVVDDINSNTNYELIQIESNNLFSNNIFDNTFNNLMTTPLIKTQIFSTLGQANFYNNFIGNNIIISNSNVGANLNPLIGFKYIDNKIYFYNMGNFYEENTGCIDADNNGFCDSPYTSGTQIDNFPLSSYPFDFTQHLFTATNVVNNIDFNITLLTPTPNQIFNLVDTNSIINLSFNEDSDFTNLVCDYVVDGNSINGGQITNTVKNQINSVNVNGWTDGVHTYRVECVNSFINKISNEITITTNLQTGGGNNNTGGGNNNTGGGNNNNGGGNVTTADFVDIQVIDFNSISNTNDNAVGFIQDIAGFVVNLGIPMAILIVVILSFLAVLRLLI